jgi:hypothetical protein
MKKIALILPKLYLKGGLILEALGLDPTYMVKGFMKTETKDSTAIQCSQQVGVNSVPFQEQ